MVEAEFGNVEVKRWDMPLMRFATPDALWNTLVSTLTPPEFASAVAAIV